MWATIGVAFGFGLLCGLIGGNWMDGRDLLYICPRCKQRGGKQTKRLDHCLVIDVKDMPRDEVTYVVTEDLGDKFAVTIRGDTKSPGRTNRMDRSPPSLVRVECNGKSKGLRLLVLDSITAQQIQVTESRGTSLELNTVRQSRFGTINIHRARCNNDEPVMLLSGGGDSTNNCAFGFTEISACDAKTYLRLQGATKTNACRINRFDQIMLHCPWESMSRDIYADWYRQRQRSFLELRTAVDNDFGLINCRLDEIEVPESIAIDADERSVANVVEHLRTMSGKRIYRSREFVRGDGVTILPQ